MNKIKKTILGLLLFCVLPLQAFYRDEPLITPDVIAFLEEFFQENPNARVLEFGSGVIDRMAFYSLGEGS